MEAHRVGNIVSNETIIKASLEHLLKAINVSDDKLVNLPESLQLLVETIHKAQERVDEGEEKVVDQEVGWKDEVGL
jgi:hypothetical protein